MSFNSAGRARGTIQPDICMTWTKHRVFFKTRVYWKIKLCYCLLRISCLLSLRSITQMSGWCARAGMRAGEAAEGCYVHYSRRGGTYGGKYVVLCMTVSMM